jgi:peptidoglycan/LPS O-acetylase OafA/YrhL
LSTTSSSKPHLWHIDVLKLLAAHAVLGHHISAYGPLPEVLATRWPKVVAWFFNDARMAVQVFLVLGGFLAAQSLNRLEGYAVRALCQRICQRIWQRYVRLVLPYSAALVLAILGAALAKQWWMNEAIPDAPTLWQILMHVLLLQDLAHQPALSTGVWYVAIDFQLFVMLTLCCAWGQRLAVWMVLALTVFALFHVNLNPDWDMWGLYFFGAYGLGVLAAWAVQSAGGGLRLAMLTALGGAALWFSFRERLALAVVVAVGLGVAQLLTHPRPHKWASTCIRRILPVSYALFLIHFPICLLANALWVHMHWQSVGAALACTLAIWLISLILAVLFHEQVEQRIARILRHDTKAVQ